MNTKNSKNAKFMLIKPFKRRFSSFSEISRSLKNNSTYTVKRTTQNNNFFLNTKNSKNAKFMLIKPFKRRFCRFRKFRVLSKKK